MPQDKKVERKPFIVFEGIDGVGKTTLSQRFAKEYNARWEPEPTDTGLGEKIRDILQGRIIGANPNTLRHLFAADRAQHSDFIKWALELDMVVLDRYCYSAYAYNMDTTAAKRDLSAEMEYLVMPDLVFLLDADPVKVRQRLEKRGTLQRFDDLDTQRQVRDRYLRLWREWPGFFVRIDASADLDSVYAKIQVYFNYWLERRRGLGLTGDAVSSIATNKDGSNPDQ